MKKVLLLSFRKTYSVFSLARHAILEVTSSIQTHTLLGYLNHKKKYFEIKGIEALYVWPDTILELEKIEEQIVDYNPEIVAVSLLHVDFGAYLTIRKSIERLLHNKKIFWIAGGYLPTSIPKETLIKGKFDILIQCHGEVPFYLLLNYLSSSDGKLEDIPNLCWLKNGELVSTIRKNYPEEESTVKLIYDPFSVEDYVKESWQIPAISDMKYLTSWYTRGCPFNCSFCLNEKMNLGNFIVRDPSVVVDEILEMKDIHGINYVFFADENFLINRKAARNILELMVKKKTRSSFRFTFMTNVGSVARGDDDLLPLLKEAGCEEIQYGVESGSELILAKMNKNNKLDECMTVFELTAQHGMMGQAMLVLGYEGETIHSLEETKNFIKQLRPDRLSYFFAVPFPNTDIYKFYKNRIHNLPFYFFDSDFPTFPVYSLEHDLLKNKINPDYFCDQAFRRILAKHKFEFSPSQKYLLNFREKMMHEYYVSDVFFEKQKYIYNTRVIKYGEDKNLLIKAAREWFDILERSINMKDYSNKIINYIKGFGNEEE